jgi:translation initiation factor 2 subunit 1
MPLLKKDEWPEIGELVVATVIRITDYGIYVALDEYDKEGFLHISEISSRWVKNIRDYAREGEKIVLKVLRVDPEKRLIDLSLRRVTNREKRDKILQWKRSKKADSLLRRAAQNLGMSIEEFFAKVEAPLEKAFGDIYEGLESAAREGVDVLLETGLPKEVAEALTEVAKEKIKTSMVKVKGILKITCAEPNGVLRIKEALLKAKKIDVPRGVEVGISVVSPPKYRIEITARDYKEANSLLRKAADIAIESIILAGGHGVLERGQ